MRRFFVAGDVEDVGVVCMRRGAVLGEFINCREGAYAGGGHFVTYIPASPRASRWSA